MRGVYKVSGRKWESLGSYKSGTFKMPCEPLGYWVSPEELDCFNIERRPACTYRKGRIVLKDVQAPDKVIEWSNELTQYTLLSGIEVYETFASICHGSGAAGGGAMFRFYNSISSQYLDEGAGFYGTHYFRFVSPDGKILLSLNFRAVTMWGLENHRILKREGGMNWIPLA